MEKEQLKRIILDQKEELARIQGDKQLLERETVPSYRKLLDADTIKVITGIRRCGKSTLACQLLKGRPFAYLNFDDERLVGCRTDDLDLALEIFYEVYGDFKWVLLDEVQNVSRWELFVNRLQRQGLNPVITGSNAHLLSRELSTHLTGRHVSLELFPFSFKEFLRFYGIQADSSVSTREAGKIQGLLTAYLHDGGFPEILRRQLPARIYLQGLFNDLVTRDVVLRHKIRQVETLKKLASHLVTNHGRAVTANRLKNLYGVKSTNTVLEYLSFLQEPYLFRFIERYSFKHHGVARAPRKVYCIDSGMIQALSLKFSSDSGYLWENTVAVELDRRRRAEQQQLFYWQNQARHEIDFMVAQGLKPRQLIQVCYGLADPDTRKREERALLYAGQALKCRDLVIINPAEEKEERKGDQVIRYAPFWKWLLE